MALKRYRRFQSQGGWQQIAEGPVLKIGDRDQRVPAIRQHLARTDNVQAESQEPLVFDSELSAGLKRFQRRHYLGNSGNLTRATVYELNAEPAYHIDMIRANLERARWVTHDIPDVFVFVDIAGYNVYLIENQKIVKTYKAQVGEPYRQTPVFKAHIQTIVLNPNWTAPPGIVDKDILPKIREDLGYLEEAGLELMNLDGRKIDPASIDWNKVKARSFPYRFRKSPGPDNPMGKVKILFPNRHYVFLHDTFEKEKFEDDWRAQSAGCIRVQSPLELTAELLSNDPDWDLDKLRAFVDTGKTKTIMVKPPVPIILFYMTVSVNDSGEVFFREDVYERDDAIVKGLSSPFAFHHQG
jgi:murein L,D-transpeptidase YcbB/YkuD